MRKILAFLSVFTICSPFASLVSACAFQANDLSTWGNAQKDIINKAYIDAGKSWYSITNPSYQTWGWWKINDELILDKALNKINPKINLGSNVVYGHSSDPKNKDNLNDLFSQGLNLSLKSTDDDWHRVNGNFHMTIKGAIKPVFNRENLNSWGADQTAIINNAYLDFAKKWYKQQTPGNRNWNDWVWLNYEQKNSPENHAVINGVQKIGGDVFSSDISYGSINNTECGDLKQALAKGIELYINAWYYTFQGRWYGEIKGTI